MGIPAIVSAVNGIKVPLHPSQVGMMWRFKTPENRLVIQTVGEKGVPGVGSGRRELPVPQNTAQEAVYVGDEKGAAIVVGVAADSPQNTAKEALPAVDSDSGAEQAEREAAERAAPKAKAKAKAAAVEPLDL